MSTVGERLVLKATDLDYKAQGVARHEGEVIFIPGLIDGETALVEIVKADQSFATAKIIDLLEKSPDRIKNQIVYQGADMAHISHEKRLLWQQRLTDATFMKVAGLTVRSRLTVTDGVLEGYRNKSVFHVMEESILTLGLFAPANEGLRPITSYVLSDELTNHIVRELNHARIKVRRGDIRHVVIRTNNRREAIVTLVVSHPAMTSVKDTVRVLEKMPGIKGVMANVHQDKRVILSGESVVLSGENALAMAIRSTDIIINDTAFFQINAPVAQKAYQIIKKSFAGAETLIDAYSGVGTIGFSLKDQFIKITMIDAAASNIKVASETKERYGLTAIDVIQARLEKMILPKADAIIVDPPRNGLMPELVEKLLTSGIRHLAYLSCDVKTLSRDAGKLALAYTIKDVYPIAMFPKTSSLETLAIFTLKTDH